MHQNRQVQDVFALDAPSLTSIEPHVWPDETVPSPLVFANPFTAGGEIHATLPPDTPAAVRIHDARGRVVCTLVAGGSAEDARVLTWNGRDDEGRTVPAGIYFLRVDAGGQGYQAKLVLAGRSE